MIPLLRRKAVILLSFYITFSISSFSTILKVIYFSCCAKKETEAQRVKQISQSYTSYLLHTTACATLWNATLSLYTKSARTCSGTEGKEIFTIYRNWNEGSLLKNLRIWWMKEMNTKVSAISSLMLKCEDPKQTHFVASGNKVPPWGHKKKGILGTDA